MPSIYALSVFSVTQYCAQNEDSNELAELAAILRRAFAWLKHSITRKVTP